MADSSDTGSRAALEPHDERDRTDQDRENDEDLPPAEPNAVDDPMLSLAGLRESAAQYAGTDLRNPLAAPLHGDLTALPPLLIQVGTREILLSDSTRVAERAVRAGVDVTLEVEEGLIHVWQMLPELPEARVSIERIGRFIRQHC